MTNYLESTESVTFIEEDYIQYRSKILHTNIPENYKEDKRKVMFYHDVVIKNYIHKIHSYEYQIVFLILGHRNNIIYD